MANGIFNLKQVNQAIQQRAWSNQKTPIVNYLVVAGGGAGGGAYGGGGGGGGFLTGVTTVTAGSAITVTVGAGGTGNTGQGPSGSNSVFGSIVSTGGGGGCTGQSIGSAGGSGGGNGGGGVVNSIGAAVAGQGNVGGVGGSGTGPAPGGGGGAGSRGMAGQGEGPAGGGGPGASSAITGNVVAYAGGGGSGTYQRGTTTGLNGRGGPGGGGPGGDSAAPAGTGVAGTANTGGGGGGASTNGPSSSGGNGGSGFVAISYPDTYVAAASTTGSPTISTSGAGSISFSGSNQSLNYAAQTPFSFGTGDFTIEVWAYPTGGLAATPSYIDFRGSSSASPAPVLYNDNGTLTYWVAGSTRITASYATLNAWVHIAVCRTGTSTKMYVNGTQVGATFTDANSYTVGTGGPYIGQNGASGGYFTGYMSNIRIVKGVCVYTGTFTPPTAPLAITQPAGTNIAAITGTQTSLLLPANSGAFSADISSNGYAVASSSLIPTWNAASPFTVLGFKNRVYTWTGNGSITF